MYIKKLYVAKKIIIKNKKFRLCILKKFTTKMLSVVHYMCQLRNKEKRWAQTETKETKDIDRQKDRMTKSHLEELRSFQKISP